MKTETSEERARVTTMNHAIDGFMGRHLKDGYKTPTGAWRGVPNDYHRDWNLLHEVIAKIEAIPDYDFAFEVTKYGTGFFENYEGLNAHTDARREKLDLTHETVFDAIIWLQSQPKFQNL